MIYGLMFSNVFQLLIAYIQLGMTLIAETEKILPLQ